MPSMAAFHVADNEEQYKPTFAGVPANWPVVYVRNNGEAGIKLCPS